MLLHLKPWGRLSSSKGRLNNNGMLAFWALDHRCENSLGCIELNTQQQLSQLGTAYVWCGSHHHTKCVVIPTRFYAFWEAVTLNQDCWIPAETNILSRSKQQKNTEQCIATCEHIGNISHALSIPILLLSCRIPNEPDHTHLPDLLATQSLCTICILIPWNP